MNILFARIQPRRRADSPSDALLRLYLDRIARYQTLITKDFANEIDLLAHLEKGRRPILALGDASGDQATSVGFSSKLRGWIDGGAQQIVLAIGPPDGWSAEALARADYKLAFGKITLPHELAAVILAEQTYRALTILAGHPYHTGH